MAGRTRSARCGPAAPRAPAAAAAPPPPPRPRRCVSPMPPRRAASLKKQEERLRGWPSTAAVLLPNGRAPQVGEVFRQTDLAASLQYMADEEKAAAGRSRNGHGRA